MIKCDYHTHTDFCDGKNTPEEMVIAAIEKGMDCLGFSGHSFSPGESKETSFGMKDDVCVLYKNEIRRLREKYDGKIRILCGIEMDYYSENSLDGYDYIIGSVHEVRTAQGTVVVDCSAEMLKNGIDRFFGGDPMNLAESYYRLEADIVSRTKCDIIGHFDLLTKFNERECIIDTGNPRYIKAWQTAADELLKYGIPFEINTGAISRGYRTTPYPAEDITEYIIEHGGRFILSSDSHSTQSLCLGFEELSSKYSAYLTVHPKKNAIE